MPSPLPLTSSLPFPPQASMQPPCRVVNLPLATIDPTLPSTHTQLLHLSTYPPFSSGSWSLTFLPAPLKPSKYTPSKVRLSWTGCELVAPWSRGRICVAEKEEGGKKGRVFDLLLQPDEGTFPSGKNGEVEIKVGRPARAFEVYLDVDMQEEEMTCVSRCLALIDRQYTLDVCLTFPPSSRTLWASSAMLAEASPWWKTTLSATGFSEGLGIRIPQPLSSQMDDSDDEEEEEEKEEDYLPMSRLATPPPSPPLSPPQGFSTFPPTSSSSITTTTFAPGFRTIPITGTSYHTYRAFLCYLLTSHLSFAPLTSTFLSSTFPSLRAARRARAAALTPSSRLNPSLPLPISPKSLFRLAHFLEMPSLARLALEAIREGLSVENVAFELFGCGEGEEEGEGSPLGEVYEEVWDMQVEWARERWEEVRQSEGMKAVAGRMRGRAGGAGDGRGVGAVGEYEVETLLRLAGVGGA